MIVADRIDEGGLTSDATSRICVCERTESCASVVTMLDLRLHSLKKKRKSVWNAYVVSSEVPTLLMRNQRRMRSHRGGQIVGPRDCFQERPHLHQVAAVHDILKEYLGRGIDIRRAEQTGSGHQVALWSLT
jgi:hypothetical protein